MKHAIQHPLSQQALEAAKELPLAGYANLMGDNATAVALTCSVTVCALLHMCVIPTLSPCKTVTSCACTAPIPSRR